MYATRKRKRTMKQLKRTSNGTDPPKSNPSKRHRERLNSELDHLASLLPYEQAIISKLDKLSVLRLAVNYLRTKSYFQVAIYDKMAGRRAFHSLPILRRGFQSSTNQDPVSIHSSAKGKGEVSTTTPDMTCLAGADDILQALNGFLLVVTCEGEVFFASDTVEQYLGFHQSDIIHQSVMELIHSEDREQFKLQLLVRPSLDFSEMTSDQMTDAFLSFNRQHRKFTVRFRCLLDNTSGFITLEISGRLRVLYGQNLKSNASKTIALFALCSPLGVLPSSEGHNLELTFKSKHKMDLSPISLDPRGKIVFGYNDRELNDKRGYDLVHNDDLSYYSAAHQELIKTGSSGLIAYRLLNKDNQWIWLQTSSKVIYKNNKPDYISCVHRQLTVDEGSDLLGKRGSEFKLPYALTYEPGYGSNTSTAANLPSAIHQKICYDKENAVVQMTSNGKELDSAKSETLISTSGRPGTSNGSRSPEESARRKQEASTTGCCGSVGDSTNKVVSEAQSMNQGVKGDQRVKVSRSQRRIREHLKEYLQAGRRRKTPYRDTLLSCPQQFDERLKLLPSAGSDAINAFKYDAKAPGRRDVAHGLTPCVRSEDYSRGEFQGNHFYETSYNFSHSYFYRPDIDYTNPYSINHNFAHKEDFFNANQHNFYDYYHRYCGFGGSSSRVTKPDPAGQYAYNCADVEGTGHPCAALDHSTNFQLQDSECRHPCELTHTLTSSSDDVSDQRQFTTPQNSKVQRHYNHSDPTRTLLYSPNHAHGHQDHCRLNWRLTDHHSDYYSADEQNYLYRNFSRMPSLHTKECGLYMDHQPHSLPPNEGHPYDPLPPHILFEPSLSPLIPPPPPPASSSLLTPIGLAADTESIQARKDLQPPQRFPDSTFCPQTSALLMNERSYLSELSEDGNNNKMYNNNNNNNNNNKNADDALTFSSSHEQVWFGLNFTSLLNAADVDQTSNSEYSVEQNNAVPKNDHRYHYPNLFHHKLTYHHDHHHQPGHGATKGQSGDLTCVNPIQVEPKSTRRLNNAIHAPAVQSCVNKILYRDAFNLENETRLEIPFERDAGFYESKAEEKICGGKKLEDHTQTDDVIQRSDDKDDVASANELDSSNNYNNNTIKGGSTSSSCSHKSVIRLNSRCSHHHHHHHHHHQQQQQQHHAVSVIQTPSFRNFAL